METDTEAEARDKLAGLVRDMKTAMLVTHANMNLHARPMAVAEVSGDADVWFASRISSHKVDELLSAPDVLVTMQKDHSYLALNGRAELQRDPDRIRALWNEGWRLWFEGPNDPELVLIRVRPYSAEYWDHSGSNGLRLALRAAKAYLQDERIEAPDDVRTHAKVPL